MRGGGLLGKGNINVNSAESVYRLNPFNIFIGIVCGLFFQGIMLAIVYFALESTMFMILLCLILMAIGDIFFIAVSVYSSRLYLREEMVDMASMFASYNPQILNGGSGMLTGAMQTLQTAKNESREEIELLLQLQVTLERLEEKELELDEKIEELNHKLNEDNLPHFNK